MAGGHLYLADISTSANRGRTLAPMAAAWSVGATLGPAIGGIMADKWGLQVSLTLHPFLPSSSQYPLGVRSLLCFRPPFRRATSFQLDLFVQFSDFWFLGTFLLCCILCCSNIN